MGSGMTIGTALERIAHLVPTYRSPVLKGEGVWVLTSPAELPPELRALQAERTAYYMSHDWTEGHRTNPPEAPRYVVTSYSVPIGWVSLDGRTHFPAVTGSRSARTAAIRRHQEAVRAVWPERFALNSEDGDVTSRRA